MCVCRRPRDLVCFGALSNMLRVVVDVVCLYVNMTPAHSRYARSDVYLCSRLHGSELLCACTGMVAQRYRRGCGLLGQWKAEAPRGMLTLHSPRALPIPYAARMVCRSES